MALRRVAVIMAGGHGERFWPLSRQARPKQLLCLTKPDESMIQEAVRRIVPLIPAESIFLATSADLAEVLRKQELPIPAENILAEPTKRNTAGCLTWVAASLKHRYRHEDVVMAVLTADHFISPEDGFRATVEKALDTAEKEASLVTIGVTPTRAETGYGYLEADPSATGDVLPVKRFCEKPDGRTALRFLDSGHYYWNSGMFFWRLSIFMDEMEKASPKHHASVDAISTALINDNHAEAKEHFGSLPSISIDYALMEKASCVKMVKAGFAWDDVGAWDAIDRSRKADDNHNRTSGNPILIGCSNATVLNYVENKEMAVGVVGLDNVIVIVTSDGILVTSKDRAQDVKAVVAELRSGGSDKI